MSDWQYGTDLDGLDRQVWEDKVRHSLYSERLRERADVERKELKENPRAQEFTDEEGLD